MPKIFISYRRGDTAAAAGRVYDRFSHLLSKRNVFFDVNAIGGGEDFDRKIADAIGKSDAALIFIGDKWVEPTQRTGKVRIWEPNDYVRAEVRGVLTRPILVLPILVAHASMPNPEQLPEDIRAITAKNALPLRHESFDDDTENIVAVVLGMPARARPWEHKGTLWSKITYAIGGAIAATVFVLVGALVHFWVLARPLAASIGGPATTLMMVASFILGGWIGLSYEARKRGLR